MKNDYTVSFTVDLPAEEVFRRISDVRAWWNEGMKGSSERPGDEFTVQFGDVHRSTQRVDEWEQNVRLVWRVTDSDLNFISQRNEWTGTRIVFDLSGTGKGTRVVFTHVGLNRDVECFDACSKGWDYYIGGSLVKLLSTGKGTPELR